MERLPLEGSTRLDEELRSSALEGRGGYRASFQCSSKDDLS